MSFWNVSEGNFQNLKDETVERSKKRMRGVGGEASNRAKGGCEFWPEGIEVEK
jgi:hypothetical protein